MLKITDFYNWNRLVQFPCGVTFANLWEDLQYFQEFIKSSKIFVYLQRIVMIKGADESAVPCIFVRKKRLIKDLQG